MSVRSPASSRAREWQSIMPPRPMCCRSAKRCVRSSRLAGFAPGLDSAVLNISAADVAKDGYRGLMANKRIVLPGLGIKIVPLLLRLFPRAFILAAVARFQLRKH